MVCAGFLAVVHQRLEAERAELIGAKHFLEEQVFLLAIHYTLARFVKYFCWYVTSLHWENAVELFFAGHS